MSEMMLGFSMKKMYMIILMIGVCIILIWPTQKFLIFNVETNELLKIYPYKNDSMIDYSYIHSVSKTPIHEILVLGDDGQIHLREVRYIDQGGAGMPEFAYDDEVFSKDGEQFVISNFNRSFKEISIKIQKNYKNNIKYLKNEVDLTALVEDGETIVIKIGRINFLNRFLNACKSF